MGKLLQAAALATAALIAITGCVGGDADSSERSVTVRMYPVVSDEARHKELWSTQRDRKSVV